ncbi:hypothetical protein [Bauldia litoralis]|uniref:hypothetical protein n=1 Tax=Bauldia litoralis TaxID=665467 RepID=UPI0032633920
MPLERHTVSVTTNSSGAGSATLSHITGIVRRLQYVKTDFADGVDFDVVADLFGDLWNEDDVNASAIRTPKTPTHATDGSASLYAGSGEPVETDIYLVDETITFTIADGGSTKTGTFHVIVETP